MWLSLGCVIIWWLHCECWCWQLPSTKFGCHRPRLISHTIRTFPQTVREAEPSRRLVLDPASRKSQQLTNKHQINQWQKYQTTHHHSCLCREYFIGSNLSKGIRCVFSGNNSSYARSPDVGWHTFLLLLLCTLVISQSINPIVNSCWQPAQLAHIGE